MNAVVSAEKKKILVVDDDRLVLATVAHGLATAGYQVIDTDNGDEAILLARQHRPVLALLDIRMDGKSGYDVAEVLRTYDIPFMFLSAFDDAATRAKVRELGAVDKLTKPLEVGQILPAVEAALQRIASGAVRGEASDVPAPAAPTPVAPVPVAAPAAAVAPAPEIDPVPLAVGVLMHRHTLTRSAARERLQKLADEKRLSLVQQAERLVDAIEELARSAL